MGFFSRVIPDRGPTTRSRRRGLKKSKGQRRRRRRIKKDTKRKKYTYTRRSSLLSGRPPVPRIFYSAPLPRAIILAINIIVYLRVRVDPPPSIRPGAQNLILFISLLSAPVNSRRPTTSFYPKYNVAKRIYVCFSYRVHPRHHHCCAAPGRSGARANHGRCSTPTPPYPYTSPPPLFAARFSFRVRMFRLALVYVYIYLFTQTQSPRAKKKEKG